MEGLPPRGAPLAAEPTARMWGVRALPAFSDGNPWAAGALGRAHTSGCKQESANTHWGPHARLGRQVCGELQSAQTATAGQPLDVGRPGRWGAPSRVKRGVAFGGTTRAVVRWYGLLDERGRARAASKKLGGPDGGRSDGKAESLVGLNPRASGVRRPARSWEEDGPRAPATVCDVSRRLKRPQAGVLALAQRHSKPPTPVLAEDRVGGPVPGGGPLFRPLLLAGIRGGPPRRLPGAVRPLSIGGGATAPGSPASALAGSAAFAGPGCGVPAGRYCYLTWRTCLCGREPLRRQGNRADFAGRAVSGEISRASALIEPDPVASQPTPTRQPLANGSKRRDGRDDRLRTCGHPGNPGPLDLRRILVGPHGLGLPVLGGRYRGRRNTVGHTIGVGHPVGPSSARAPVAGPGLLRSGGIPGTIADVGDETIAARAVLVGLGRPGNGGGNERKRD
ncbi:hypothetical protein Tco_0991582 [Tanacetum coccineum]|uniref:Uncharacterized protein n=1 Tax=Tanacetum coccineum TaxID=301880 RepID=A0ABQ5F0E8_9ASTR